MIFSDDPIRDYNRHESMVKREHEERKKRTPTCECGNSIIDFDYAWNIGGAYYCEECITRARMDTDLFY